MVVTVGEIGVCQTPTKNKVQGHTLWSERYLCVDKACEDGLFGPYNSGCDTRRVRSDHTSKSTESATDV